MLRYFILASILPLTFVLCELSQISSFAIIESWRLFESIERHPKRAVEIYCKKKLEVKPAFCDLKLLWKKQYKWISPCEGFRSFDFPRRYYKVQLKCQIEKWKFIFWDITLKV